jgi:predicted enzyme related to lactoylglutathione lyase
LINTGTEGPGINGGMLPRSPLGAVNTIGFASLDNTLKAVEASGGKVIMPSLK